MLRRCEGCPSDIDEQLLADLKDWRLRTSKDMSVPAYVVFTDNTLIAIAETLPDRRRRARRDSRHRRAQARAVRSGCARVGQRPPIFVKIVPNPQVRKSVVSQRLLRLASRSSRADERRVAAIMTNINAFTGVGVAGMSRTLHVIAGRRCRGASRRRRCDYAAQAAHRHRDCRVRESGHHLARALEKPNGHGPAITGSVAIVFGSIPESPGRRSIRRQMPTDQRPGSR